MSFPNPTQNDNGAGHSEPIPIASHGRSRSLSLSSGSPSSASSYSPLQTPVTPGQNGFQPSSPVSSSPILSYFLAQSPNSKSSNAATFPLRRFGNVAQSPVFEEDEAAHETPGASHARRASVAATGRFVPTTGSAPAPMPDSHLERGTGMLRRLSLSASGFGKSPPSPPSPPPNSAVTPTESRPLGRKPRRSATVSSGSGNNKVRRAPSPMGERILKGHFDGFN